MSARWIRRKRLRSRWVAPRRPAPQRLASRRTPSGSGFSGASDCLLPEVLCAADRVCTPSTEGGLSGAHLLRGTADVSPAARLNDLHPACLYRVLVGLFHVKRGANAPRLPAATAPAIPRQIAQSRAIQPPEPSIAPTSFHVAPPIDFKSPPPPH